MIEWILSSSILILIVIALRTCFKGKISLRLQYAIWGLVLLRLLIPVSFGSANFSVANLAEAAQDQPVIQVIQDMGNLNIPSQSYEDAYNQVVQEYEAQGINVDSLQGSELEALEYEAYGKMKGKSLSQIAGDIAVVIWFAGIILVGSVFLATNARFRNRIMTSRYALDMQKNHLDVYVTGEIDTPCLFGIRNPAIYVTYPVADDPTMLRHTLEHEATHYRHGDHIWAVLRCVCLAVHWYNPLVWWAAFLSQRDAELACDEATIKRLGEGERAEYGRTLIGMTCRKKANVLITATTMNSGKSGLKERIMLIAKKPKMALYTLLIVVLVASIAVGCTFTGAKTDGQGARGEILDKNGEVIVSKELEEGTIPAESTEATELVTEPTATEIPDDAPPVNIPEMLHEQPEENKICIAVQPTGLISEGGAYLYIIPGDQEGLLEYYTAAKASAHEYTKWDSSNKRTGWWIVYQDMWWQVTESGAMFGIDRENLNGVTVDSGDAKELYEFCDAAVRNAGIGEPVRPEDITEIKSATLYWNGEHTVTDAYALNKIEAWLHNSEEESGTSCWFTAQLLLELEGGEQKIITMATDDCATWMSEGVTYSFREVTNVGIEGNEEFYSLFATDIIHEKAKAGADAMADYWYYTNWRMYSNLYSTDETFALMDMFREFAVSNPADWIVSIALRTSRGLDGAFAEYYAGVLAALYEASPSTFRFACRQMIPEEDVERAVDMLAFYWNASPAEVWEKLEAE